jgi:transcriptional regulator with XRE-family HTH domain
MNAEEIETWTEDQQRKLGKLLSGLRQKAGKSLRQVQRELGVSASHLASLEKGEGKGNRPRRRFLRRLAEYYGAPVRLLLRGAGYQLEDEPVMEFHPPDRPVFVPRSGPAELVGYCFSPEGTRRLRELIDYSTWLAHEIQACTVQLQQLWIDETGEWPYFPGFQPGPSQWDS